MNSIELFMSLKYMTAMQANSTSEHFCFAVGAERISRNNDPPPHQSGANMFMNCNCYECSSYTNLCDYCAEDVCDEASEKNEEEETKTS